jgi:hypothetical protein
MVLTVSFVISPGTGLSCPRRFVDHSAKLGASVGTPGPHDFAVRVHAVRLSAHPRPPHPASYVRDDRETPLMWEQDGGDMDVIWREREGKYFLVTDWTGGIALIRFDNFAVWRRASAGRIGIAKSGPTPRSGKSMLQATSSVGIFLIYSPSFCCARCKSYRFCKLSQSSGPFPHSLPSRSAMAGVTGCLSSRMS